jgi:chemotaxis protein histidine kinase CheA
MEDNFDLKIKHDFITESLEMLSWVEDQFLVFEQNPSDSKVVDEIFRMAHTVKGSAMTCGFLRLGEFAHVMETLLVKIREGRHEPDSETVDVLLRANDTLRQYIELLRKDFDAVLDTESMKEDLQYFIGPDAAPQHTVPTVAFGFFDDDEIEASASSLAKTTPSVSQKEDLRSEGFATTPIDEIAYLTLKAYLSLSSDSSEAGVDACLRTLEKALSQLALLRG